MRKSRLIGSLPAFILLLGLAISYQALKTTSANLAAAPVTPQAGVLRTLGYHQITSLTGSFSTSSGVSPVLSASGNRAVYTVSPGSGDPANPNRIFVINADGTGGQQVDSYTPFCFCRSLVDISADGSKVISSDSVQLRIANADGSGARQLVAFDNIEMEAIRIAGDGSKVFFLARHDLNFRGTSTNAPRGVWVINADGSGRRQIVNADQVASLLGITPGEVFPFATSFSTALSVSNDGSRIVFGTQAKGQRMFGVNLDGTGLHQLIGPVDYIKTTGLSADGSKALYQLFTFATNTNEVGVINFDGTGQRKLTDDRNGPVKSLGGPGDSGDRFQLSADGSKLLLGSSSVLMDTATGAPLQLGVRTGAFSSDPPPVVDVGMYRATMNSSATRFLYVIDFCDSCITQLAVLDLNPASLGQAPSVTEPKIDPSFVITQGRSSATVSARASTTNTLVRVGNAILFGGLDDGNVSHAVMFDDGSNGDATAGDGSFTNNGVRANSDAVVGARSVRVKAEVRAGDGKRHATAIDFEPFTVTNQVPAIEVSPTSLDFGNVNVGSAKDLTLTIRNNGTVALTINSISSNNAPFSAPAPTAPFTIAAGGQQQVTVRFAPGTAGSQSGRLTINSTDPARPSIDVTLSGAGIAQTCTYTIAPASKNFAASGGNGSVVVTTQSGCAWTATSNAAFITVTSGTAGSGNGTVNYSVAANTGAARSGTITVARQTFTVTQDAGTQTCTYSIAPTNQSFAANGGTGSVNVTTQPNCAWTATSNAGFITITSGTPGNGSGALNYSVAANTSASLRTGTLTIAGQTFTVTQDGSTPCTFTISPTGQSFTAGGGTGSVNVNASQNNCPWTAASNAAWIRITSSSSGTGNGTVNYAVDPNTGSSQRTGTLTIAGLTFTVTQAGSAPCTFTVSPTSQAFQASGGTGSVNVNASQNNCPWAATNNVAWIRITSGSSGTGNGAVNYSVDPNTSGSPRTGTLTIAGLTFTVNQTGASGGPIIRIEPTTLNFNAPGPGGSSIQQALAQQPAPSLSSSASSGRPEIDEEEAGLRREYWEWFYRQRRYPFDQIPAGARLRAWELQEQLREQTNALAPQISATQWMTIGPAMTRSERWGNVTGRVTSLIAHPNNPNTVYIGTAQGGVWRTTDGGATWTSLTDRQPSLAIGALAFDPSNPNIIHAATGEQNFSGDSYYGNGVLKSTDGGASWTVLGATTFARQEIGKLAVHPTNGQIIFAAASNGLMRTTNGGATWTRALSGLATDVLFAPGNPNTLYATIRSDGIYRSTDGGANWVKLANGLPATNIYRAHLAISTANPNTLAAVFTTEDKLEGVYRTTDGGASWARTTATPADIFGGQGFYNVFIAMHPANANLIYVGGIDVARTTDGGVTWTNATRSYQGAASIPISTRWPFLRRTLRRSGSAMTVACGARIMAATHG